MNETLEEKVAAFVVDPDIPQEIRELVAAKLGAPAAEDEE